ncbi:helix-turn-helix domain-containing protein [Delftia sp. RIT313]|uniref:helix-turn-helix domain-containing protein n=1 Tax=Delftia sp. RIT313 TaxID=1468410 RepID=UPI0012684CE3|nr:helix-turn-helix domain-containing protein [Delftia sp. RIT313]
MKRVDAEILTVEDLAELFICDKETAAARLISGDLPGVKLGRGWIIPRQALFERLNEKAKEESAERRAQRMGTFKKNQQLDQKSNSSLKPSRSAPQIPYTAATIPMAKGRKRRSPPALPSLPK